MPIVEGGYVNPYYQEVEDYVVKELNARGRIYGARVRSSRAGAEGFPRDLSFAYQKVAYVRITPRDIALSDQNASTLGGSNSKIMSDRKGNLTLYDSTRNQPKFPLLQSLEISNEGTIGSLLKGKFTFTVYPDLFASGFSIEKLEESYFKPGREVKIEWGWSVSANNAKANNGSMIGIIYNFDWQVNPDLSITANCAIVSKATIAMGLSGEQTNPSPSDPPTEDPLGKPIPDSDLAGIIERDIAELQKSGKGTSITMAHKSFYSKDITASGINFREGSVSYGLEYYVIGIPKSPADEPGSDKKIPPPVNEPTYYVSLKCITELVNGLIAKAGNTDLVNLYTVKCDGNLTEHLPDIVSCIPHEVFFPDDEMGKYGNFNPFAAGSELTKDSDGNQIKPKSSKKLINIGNILLSTSTIIEIYRKFVQENQTTIEYKNITSFFKELITKVNYASGEAYQLDARLLEPDQLTGNQKAPKAAKENAPAILSIEDSNLAAEVCAEVQPYKLESSIAKPLIKNMSITSKPPGPMAMAAYAEARGQKNGGKTGNGKTSKSGPQQSDVRSSTDAEIDIDKFTKEFEEAKKSLIKIKEEFITQGASDKFSTDLKGAYAKYKRAARGEPGNGNGAHWLNRALYPVDLSLTIDGINGLKFGDVLKTNLIPATYNHPDSDMVFVITKITHTVKDGIWETKIDTKSRINMGQNKPKTTDKS